MRRVSRLAVVFSFLRDSPIWKPTCFLITIGILLSHSTAVAENSVAESIEWMVADSDLIVRGTISQVVEEKGPYSVVWEKSTVKVHETLKGRKQQEITFIFRNVAYPHCPSNWKKEGAELLLFLVNSRRYVSLDPGYEKVPLALRRFGARSCAVRLDGKAEGDRYARIFTKNFKVLWSREAILKATRAAAVEDTKYKGTRPRKSARIEVPGGTEAYNDLYGGSAVFLIVPIDSPMTNSNTSGNDTSGIGKGIIFALLALIVIGTAAAWYFARRWSSRHRRAGSLSPGSARR